MCACVCPRHTDTQVYSEMMSLDNIYLIETQGDTHHKHIQRVRDKPKRKKENQQTPTEGDTYTGTYTLSIAQYLFKNKKKQGIYICCNMDEP